MTHLPALALKASRGYTWPVVEHRHRIVTIVISRFGIMVGVLVLIGVLLTYASQTAGLRDWEFSINERLAASRSERFESFASRISRAGDTLPVIAFGALVAMGLALSRRWRAMAFIPVALLIRSLDLRSGQLPRATTAPRRRHSGFRTVDVQLPVGPRCRDARVLARPRAVVARSRSTPGGLPRRRTRCYCGRRDGLSADLPRNAPPPRCRLRRRDGPGLAVHRGDSISRCGKELTGARAEHLRWRN